MENNSEEHKFAKSDKSSSLPTPAMNAHPYPDWAALQAYYGSRHPIPSYYNSAVTSGQTPHPPPPYIWGPQTMMSPYGAPYAALYYAHPGVPMPPGQKVTAATGCGTALSIDNPTKTTGNSENGLMKKLKEFDGLAMSIGNGQTEHKRSLSSETEGSFDGSEGNTSWADQPKIKKSREGSPAKDGIHLPQCSPLSSVSMDAKPVPAVSAKSDQCPSQSLAMVPSEAWLQNDRELKRERRKQSNRESARRSRLKKQAETEELGKKVEALAAENMALRSEINHLTEKSEKLRVENTDLMEKLKGSDLRLKAENGQNDRVSGVNTENLHSNESNSNSKLHQLLETSPRADAVAAG